MATRAEDTMGTVADNTGRNGKETDKDETVFNPKEGSSRKRPIQEDSSNTKQDDEVPLVKKKKPKRRRLSRFRKWCVVLMPVESSTKLLMVSMTA